MLINKDRLDDIISIGVISSIIILFLVINAFGII